MNKLSTTSIQKLINEVAKQELRKPSEEDLYDALEHASSVLNDDQPLRLDQFKLKFLGNLSIKQLSHYDDISSWLDLTSDDKGDYTSFRGPEWSARAKTWASKGIPPVVIVSTANGTVVGDGRGRINYANMMGVKVPTWELSQVGELDEVNAVGAGGIVGAGMGNAGTKTAKNLLWSGNKPIKETFYHGTSSALGLQPGMKLLPPDQTDKISEKGRKKNLNKVFFTKDLGSAKIYAGRAIHQFGGEPVVFAIEPEGEVEQINATPGTTVFMSPSAKISTKLLENWFLRNPEDKVPTEEPGFFYHATNRSNLLGIIETGFLETHPPDYGTDQDEWPDESVENRSYFGTSFRHVESYFPAEGEPELLRVPKDAAKFKQERYTKDIYTTEDIPVSKLQVWSKAQRGWQDLGSYSLNESFGGSKKKLLLLVHPDIVFEMSTNSMQSYYKRIEDEVGRFDHVITHLFYSPEFNPEWLSKDVVHNNIFSNFMKMLRRNSHVIKWDNPRFMASIKQELPYYLIDHPGTTVYLAGGYKDLCVKATDEMMRDKIGSIIKDTEASVVCYEPLLIKDRNSILESLTKTVVENVLDKMNQKHVGGAARKSPYGDTYVGFSSSSQEDQSGRAKQSSIVKRVNKNLNKRPYSLHDPPSMGISERTLYHGTLIDNEQSISKLGLYPTVGEFVKQMYSYEIEEMGDVLDDHSLVYAADKDSLQKTLNAIRSQVGVKLNKSFNNVTEEDIRNHGLLAVIKDGDTVMKQAPEDGSREWDYQFLEPGDWHHDNLVGVDFFLKGSALLRFFKRHGLSVESTGKKQQELFWLAKKAKPDWTEDQIRKAISQLPDNDLNKFIANYKRHLAKNK